MLSLRASSCSRCCSPITPTTAWAARWLATAKQDLVYEPRREMAEHSGLRHDQPIDPDPNPFIFIDRNKCILCSRAASVPAADSRTATCGALPRLVLPPSWWLAPMRCCWTRLRKLRPVRRLLLIGADRQDEPRQGPHHRGRNRPPPALLRRGLQLRPQHRGGQIVRVTSAQDAPVSWHGAVRQGRYGYDYVHNQSGLTRPLVREVAERRRGGVKVISGQ